jgi:P4 family phage/plasmid primase-like protien
LNGSPSALMFIGGDQFDTLVDTLNQWALDTGGSGLDRAKEQGSVGTTALSDNTHRYSKLTSSSLKKVLGCINHADEGTWTNVANILTRVYGSQGRENFHAFSRGDLCGHPYEKYTVSECNDRFDRAIADLKNRPSGYGVKHLLSLARAHGEWRESDVVYESEFDISDLFLKELIVEQDEHPVSTEQAGGIPSNIDRMDIRNGERFREQYHRKIAFVRDTSDVLRYELDAGWVRGNSDLPLQAAKAVVTKMVEAYGNAMTAGQSGGSMLSEIKRASSRRALEDMIKLAKSEPGMSVSMSDLDKDPYLLGVKNGVVDLRSGLLLQANPDLLVTKRCNVEYDPDAKCPRFCAFLDQVVPDKAQRDFLVIVLGYFLTGLVKEQLWFFFHGVGSNGKSVLISVLENLMGDYVTKIQTEMLMQQNRSSAGAAPDLLRLQGKRLVFCNETKEGQRLDDARIKDLTGGDTITGRPLYSNNHVSFLPTHKLVVVGNYHPVVSDDSHGFWRRVVVYPFSVCIPQQNQNKDLVLHLSAEGAGILNHLLKALKVYFEQGLLVPESLSKATMVYRDDQDLIEQFLTDNCVRGRDKAIIKTELYGRYKNWCISNGLYALASNRFSRKLNAKGFEVSADKRTWVGVA